MMLQNYLCATSRNLTRHRLYTLINVLGLAVGITACVAVARYLEHEFSYDRHTKGGDRIYRVLRHEAIPGRPAVYQVGAQGPVAPALEEEFPEIEAFTRFLNRPMWAGLGSRVDRVSVTRQGMVDSVEVNWVLTDERHLDVYDIPLLEGRPLERTDVSQPRILVNAATIEALGGDFGAGDAIHFWEEDWTIVGVFEDYHHAPLLSPLRPLLIRFHRSLFSSRV